MPTLYVPVYKSVSFECKTYDLFIIEFPEPNTRCWAPRHILYYRMMKSKVDSQKLTVGVVYGILILYNEQ